MAETTTTATTATATTSATSTNSVSDPVSADIEILEFDEQNPATPPTLSNSDSIHKYLNHSNIAIKWTKADEHIIHKFIMKSLAYKTLYNQSYFRYSLYADLISYPLTFFTCISIGLQIVVSTLAMTDSASKTNKILIILNAAVTILVAMLTYLQAKTSYHARSRGCRKAAIDFSEFADKLNTTLQLSRSMRVAPREFIENMEQDYKKIMKAYFDFEIPTYIYKSFSKKHENSDLILDIATSSNSFNIYDTGLGKNEIVNKFLDSITDMKASQSRNRSETIALPV